MSWNPNATATVGNEWRAWKKGTTALNSSGVCAAVYLNSSATETIDSLMLPHTPSGAGTSYGKLWAEVYNAADLGTINETPTVYTFVPNEDLAVTNLFYTAAGVPAWSVGPFSVNTQNLDQYIDDTADESTDYIMGGDTSVIRLAFNSAGLAAGRVLSVSFEIRAFSYFGFPGQGLWIDLYNNTTFVARLATVQPPVDGDDTAKPFRNYTVGPFYTNPLTEEPWTRTDIINMDTGTNLLLGLTWRSNTTAVAAVRMKVSMIAEKRLAVGANTKSTTPASGIQTSNVHLLKTPAGVDNWAKAAATDYVVVVRRLDDPLGAVAAQSYTVPWIEAAAANPHDQGHGYGVTIDAGGRLITNTGLEPKAYPILMATTTAVLSADSQVYHTLLSGKVYGAVETEQRISNHASTTYGTVRFVVGIVGNPAAALSVKIKRNSDNVQMGGTGTLTVADLSIATWLGATDSVTWYDATVTLASVATLVAATQYYLEFSSPSSVVGAPWYMRGLEYTETHAFTTDQSYGGSTDSLILEGTAYAQGDLAATTSSAASVPPAPPESPVLPPGVPSTLTANTATYALPDAGDPLCEPGTHKAVRLAWGTTTEGALFDYYAIERSEDGGTTWTLIKRVQTESILTFDDVEAKRAVALKYRIRVVRTTGQAGAYLTQSGTVTLPTNTAAVVFCSNAFPALTCGYVQLGADHEYTFLGDSEVSVVQMHERNFQVVFRPTEDRGVMWHIPVLIFTKGIDSRDIDVPPSGKGTLAFGALRAIVDAKAPYVCVHTPDGERLFAALRVPSGRRAEPAAFYSATITAIQVANVPSVVD